MGKVYTRFKPKRGKNPTRWGDTCLMAYKGCTPGTPIHSGRLPPGLRRRFWMSRPDKKVFAYRKFKTIESRCYFKK